MGTTRVLICSTRRTNLCGKFVFNSVFLRPLKAIVEGAEVGEIGYIFHQRSHALSESTSFCLAGLVKSFLDCPRYLYQRFNEMSYITAGIVDVGLQQHAVTRSLVQLNVIVCGKQILELRAVIRGRTAYQGKTCDIERELIFTQRLHCGCPIRF